MTAFCCAGADESYEESAEREIEEEMGVRNVQLQKCFDFYHADDISRVWGRLFSCTYDGTFRLDPEEVASGDFMSVKVILHGFMGKRNSCSLATYTGDAHSSDCSSHVSPVGANISAPSSSSLHNMQEVEELMSSGKVPPDSKACMKKYLGS